jgi:hypothetical protein
VNGLRNIVSRFAPEARKASQALVDLVGLLTSSMLLSLGGCEPQLKGHIQGNLNIGNAKELLLDVLTPAYPLRRVSPGPERPALPQ